MAIQQRLGQSDLEKRLQILRRQVYVKKELSIQGSASNYQLPASKEKTATGTLTDLNYLHHDLIKILTLSSLAIGAEVVFYFLLTNHILKINFF